jgi:DNA-binding PadR family transcriptional regulator
MQYGGATLSLEGEVLKILHEREANALEISRMTQEDIDKIVQVLRRLEAEGILVYATD